MSRLQLDGRRLLLDGQPWLMRGVTYAPTPIGHDPSLFSTEDYLSQAFAGLHARDVALMQEMGANSLRVYQTGPTATPAFFDLLAQANMTAMAGHGLYVPTSSPESMMLQKSFGSW